MRRLLLASALPPALLLCVGTGAPGQPAGPSSDQAPQVTPQCGAWMVLAATYQGADGPQMARTLALYVHRTYNLPAFVYDYADANRRRENDAERLKAQQDPSYVPRYTRIEENYGVLVGGWDDDKQAAAMLKKVRSWPLPDARLPNGRPCYGKRFAMGKDDHGQEKQTVVDDNPFLSAIVCRNPTIKATPKPMVDPAWAKLNSEEEFSVFKCPKPWTLAVKQYFGTALDQPLQSSGGIMERLWPSKHEGEGINAAAFNAHELARKLRGLGFEAYVLHTRVSSVVTVGGFDGYNDDEMKRMRQRLASLHPNRPDVPDQLGLFLEPPPMPVPR